MSEVLGTVLGPQPAPSKWVPTAIITLFLLEQYSAFGKNSVNVSYFRQGRRKSPLASTLPNS